MKLPILSALTLVGAAALLAPYSARAQPLPVEAVAPKINNLSLPLVTPAEAEKLAMPAKPIDLQLREVTLREALEELSRQSGVTLNLKWADKTALDKTLSLDLKTRFFRPAFDAIADEAGIKLRLERYGRGEVWNVQVGQNEGDGGDAPQSGAGAFQVRLQSVDSNFRQTVKLNAQGAETRSQARNFSLTFNGAADPIVDVTGTPLIILKRVEDEQGRSLLDTVRNQWLRYDFDEGWSGNRAQGIKQPAEGTKKLARVEGTAVYVVPSARQRWEIADVTANTNADHEFESEGQNVQVVVKSAQIEGNNVNVSLEMSAPGRGNDEARNPLFSFGTLSRVFVLEDANGNIFRSNSSSGSSSGTKIMMRSQFSRSSRFDKADEKPKLGAPAPPLKLIFDGPTEWVQTEVPFSFSDVPLP